MRKIIHVGDKKQVFSNRKIADLSNCTGKKPKKQVLVLKSEDLYADPDLVTQKVFDFLELPKCKIPSLTHTNKGNYHSLDISLHEKLKSYFQPHNQKLENLLNMKFDW